MAKKKGLRKQKIGGKVSKAAKKSAKGFGGKGVSMRGVGALNRKLSGVGAA